MNIRVKPRLSAGPGRPNFLPLLTYVKAGGFLTLYVRLTNIVWGTMTIRSYLDEGYSPETRDVLEQAFGQTLKRLHLVDRGDPVCRMVAERVIDIFRRGTTKPAAITETAIKEIGLRDGG